jgi:hypothetical protein
MEENKENEEALIGAEPCMHSNPLDMYNCKECNPFGDLGLKPLPPTTPPGATESKKDALDDDGDSISYMIGDGLRLVAKTWNGDRSVHLRKYVTSADGM